MSGHGGARRGRAVALTAGLALLGGGLGIVVAASTGSDGAPVRAPLATSTSDTRTTAPATRRGSYAELGEVRDEPGALVGRTVLLRGRVFFFERCPPPDQPAAACELSGLLTDEERDDLQAVDLPEAIVLAEDGRPLTCSARVAVQGACPGWQDRAVYRLEGTVQRRVLGGRETDQVEIDVSSKELVRAAD